jgi:hypothetical protein
MLAAFSPLSHADVATLREKGPKSGAAFSNLGLAAMSTDVKVAMRDARVKILLKKGEGDTILAECEANFLLENLAPTETGPQDFLVAFPVTGLTSKVVMIDKFAVTVDGKTPPTVFRQGIAISRRESKLQDRVISGQLEARFAPEKSKQQWGVCLSDKAVYPNSYAWSQHTTPGAKSKVKVTYVVTMHPQSIHYSKSYDSANDDVEVIPFDNLEVENWNENYYFFDYVLVSGATWEGPIGHEIITLSISPELKLSKYGPEWSTRKPTGFRWEVTEKQVKGCCLSSSTNKQGEQYIELENGKPDTDILFAIPVKAVGQYQPENK